MSGSVSVASLSASRRRVLFVLCLRLGRPPSSTLFPYTTLFRSRGGGLAGGGGRRIRGRVGGGRDGRRLGGGEGRRLRSEEHTSELQSRQYLVCRLLLEKKNNNRRPRVGGL